MAQVKIFISGRSYVLDCDDGQEEHLRKLGEHLDNRMRELQVSSGIHNELELLLVTGVLLCDDLSDAMAKISELNKKINMLESKIRRDAADGTSSPPVEAVIPDTTELSARLEAMVGRMERLAQTVQGE